jgi:hypothetical protein
MFGFDRTTGEVVDTDYWKSLHAQNGFLHLQYNARRFSLLVPPSFEHALPNICTGKIAVISRGAFPECGKLDFFEIMFEDYSDSPYCIHISPEQLSILPGCEFRNVELRMSVLIQGGGNKPKKVLDLPCYFRMVNRIPCAKPYSLKAAQREEKEASEEKETVNMNMKRIIEAQLMKHVQHGKSYPKPLPKELEDSYCYTKDGGHSIIVALENQWRVGKPIPDILVPAPVKTVLRLGWRIKDGYVWATIPYDNKFGLQVESGDDEY